jgi:SOS-response transcriptional repressor LexA
MGRKAQPAVSSIGRKLRHRREKLGLSQEEAGMRLGLSKQRISQIERGESHEFSGTTLVALGQFLEEDETNLVPGSTKKGKKALDRGPVIQRRCPLISWRKALEHSRNMAAVLSEDVEAWYPCPVECGPSTFVLKARGASMEPKFRDGEHIFVDPSMPASAEKYVIVQVEGSEEPLLRQIILEAGRRYLRPVNALWPEPIIEVNAQTTIIGVVVYKGEPV